MQAPPKWEPFPPAGRVTNLSESNRPSPTARPASGSSPVRPTSGASPVQPAGTGAPAATPAASAPRVFNMYGMLAVYTVPFIGLLMVGLLFAPWMKLRQVGGKEAALLTATGVDLLKGGAPDDPRAEEAVFVPLETKPAKRLEVEVPAGVDVRAVFQGRMLDAEWTKFAMMAYAGAVGLVTLWGVLAFLGIGPDVLVSRAFGAAMMLGGAAAMAVPILVLFVENKIPSELGGMANHVKWRFTVPGAFGAVMGFVWVGMGSVYALAGGLASGAGKAAKAKAAARSLVGGKAFVPPQ